MGPAILPRPAIAIHTVSCAEHGYETPCRVMRSTARMLRFRSAGLLSNATHACLVLERVSEPAVARSTLCAIDRTINSTTRRASGRAKPMAAKRTSWLLKIGCKLRGEDLRRRHALRVRSEVKRRPRHGCREQSRHHRLQKVLHLDARYHQSPDSGRTDGTILDVHGQRLGEVDKKLLGKFPRA